MRTEQTAPQDSGLLDMAAFGFLPVPSAPQPTQQTAPQDSGLLDMAAFGLEDFGGPPTQPPSAAVWDAGSGAQVQSGVLDMAAFGMEPAPTAVEPVQQAQQVDSGLLDFSAFGLEDVGGQPLPLPTVAGGAATGAGPDPVLAQAGGVLPSEQRAEPLASSLQPPPGQRIFAGLHAALVPSDVPTRLEMHLGSSRTGRGGIPVDAGTCGAVGGGRRRIPGLSARESAAVVAIARALAAPNLDSSPATPALDDSARHFLLALNLAVKLGEEAALALSAGAAVGMEAADLVAAFGSSSSEAVGGGEGAGGSGRGSPPSLSQAWGLRSGLACGSLVWALLSTTSEALMHNALGIVAAAARHGGHGGAQDGHAQSGGASLIGERGQRAGAGAGAGGTMPACPHDWGK